MGNVLLSKGRGLLLDKSQGRVTYREFESLQQGVHRFWPTFQHIPNNFHVLSLFDHAKLLIKKNYEKKTDARREQFRTFLKKKIAGLLGEEIADSVYKQLAVNHSIPTAHHFTPLSPNTLNPTLLYSLPYFGSSEDDKQNVIVLACAGISFNNSWSPRGYVLHSRVGDTVIDNTLHYVGRVSDADPVISAKPFDSRLKKTFMKSLSHYRSEQFIGKREFNLLMELLDEIIFKKEILSQKRFIDQISISNYCLWKKLFSGYEGHVPNLIFLAQEDVAADLLLEFHMENKTILHHVMFDPLWHELIYKHFDNIMCAFSVKRKQGTFLFWATPSDSTYRIQLFARDGFLESQDGKIKITITPESIKRALLNNEITPSTHLTFLVLSMYYGYFLTGGLDQPTYLVQIKDAYITMLKELSLYEEIDNCIPIVVNDIVLTRPTIAFMEGPNNQRIPATILDLIVYGRSDSWLSFIEASKSVTFQEVLSRLYPELYREYCDSLVRDDRLLAITEHDIEQYIGLDKKVPAWVRL